MNIQNISISNCGGGICGLHQLFLIKEIERRTGLKFNEFCYSIAGTSIGSVISSMLGIGISSNDCYNFFYKYGKIIFKKKWYKICPKYSKDGLENALNEVFGNKRLSDSKIPILIPSFNKTTGKPYFFKSYDETCETLIKDACLASSSAQFFLPRHIINNQAHMDGGNVANQPSSSLLNDYELKNNNKDVYMINFGCGQKNELDTNAVKKANCGLISNLKDTIEATFVGQEENIDYEMNARLGNKYINLNPVLKYQVKLDGVTDADFEKMEANGESSIQQFSLQLDFIVNLIKSKVNDNKLPIKN